MSEAFELDRQQIKTVAAGLWALAKADGVDTGGHERALVEGFLRDSNAEDLIAKLDTLQFDPATAYTTLESTWLRKTFLQAAVMLVQADGKISDNERETLRWITDAFGVPGGLDVLLDAAQGQSFDS